MYAVLNALVVLFFAIAVIGVVSTLRKQNRRYRTDMKLPILTLEGTVVNKRAHLGNTQNSTTTEYFVTFEFPDTSRLELCVTPTESGQLVVGDYGTVSWSGSTLRGFQRQLLR